MEDKRNHHFVSQVHLKNFFNSSEGKIYVYDKIRKNHFNATSTRKLFSEKDSNARFVDGQVDYNELENELNEYFEKGFPKYFGVISDVVIDLKPANDFENAILYMAKYGIVGEFRTPRHKKRTDEAVFGVLSEIIEKGTPELKQQFEELTAFKKVVKYSSVVGYNKLANDILKKMGDLVFKIIIPVNEDDYFFIPDICSATVRAKINEYFNPDVEEVAYISFALSSKIYIKIMSTKLKDINPINEINYIESDFVHVLNKANYDYCDSKIACENETYLKKFAASLE